MDAAAIPMTRSRHSTLRAALLGGLLALLPACGADSDSEPWSVLLVTLDTTRADRLGCYGYGQDTTPNLDALAADGVRFEFAVSTAGITPVAHASILTGLNPPRHGVRVFHGAPGSYLDRTTPTLARILGEAGHATGAFVSAYPASERFGLDHGFDHFDNGAKDSALHTDPEFEPKLGVLRGAGDWQQRRWVPTQRRADAVTDKAIAWLEEQDGPVLQWVHYFDPHDSFLVPPRKFLQRFEARRDGPDRMARVYDADLNFMDHHVGRLLEAYRERGRMERTIVLVTADHGQGLGDHDWEQHRILYREQLQIPLIARWPGGPRGRVVPDLVRNTDLLPTITQLLGLEAPRGLDGQSVVELLDASGEPRVAYAEALNTLDSHAPGALPERHKDLLFCAVERDWKLIHHVEHPENSELYDLRADPGELVNVLDEHPEEAARLLAFLEESGGMAVRTGEVVPIEEEAARKLEALGYSGDE